MELTLNFVEGEKLAIDLQGVLLVFLSSDNGHLVVFPLRCSRLFQLLSSL